VWSEALYVTVGGIALGAVLSATIAWLLIKVLTGVFDPPPDAAAVPWSYLLALAAVAAGSVAIGGAAAVRSATRATITSLRDL
jgi:putative ABC transport system permease protein